MSLPEKKSGDESIGRPEPWGEGRYEKEGESVDTLVVTPPEPEKDTISTPVTRKDYEPEKR